MLRVHLTPDDVHPLPQHAARPTAVRLTLPPGAMLQLGVRKRLELGRGTQLAALTYATSHREGVAESLDGNLTVALGRFDVHA